jgi:hypothetical protein
MRWEGSGRRGSNTGKRDGQSLRRRRGTGRGKSGSKPGVLDPVRLKKVNESGERVEELIDGVVQEVSDGG